MAVTEKISVAIGREELRLARSAADEDGMSLSAFVSGAVRARVEERRRLEAANQVLATFAPQDIPTAEEKRALLALWTRPVAAPSKRRRRR